MAAGASSGWLDGTVSPLVERYEGHRLNSPNDVVVRSEMGRSGSGDPTYGDRQRPEGHRAEPEIPERHVYRSIPERL